MDAQLSREAHRAAHALGLDAATADVVRALTSHDIACVLLKGPATARRLYPDHPDRRMYLDIDLLVSEQMFKPAEAVLRELGYVKGFDVEPDPLQQETAWTRAGSPPTTIDLHRGFHGVGNWGAWWSQTEYHHDVITVAGCDVRVPDTAGCALIVALHDTAAGRVDQSAEDLAQALAVFPEEIWHEAARRAEAVAALPSFVLGLSSHDSGQRIIRDLGLPTELPPEVMTRSLVTTGADEDQVGRASRLEQRLGEGPGVRARLGVIIEVMFPTARFLRATHPIARRGPIGLLAARIYRPFVVASHAPGVFWLMLRGRRRARRSGWRA